jgi:hypothetical protein
MACIGQHVYAATPLSSISSTRSRGSGIRALSCTRQTVITSLSRLITLLNRGWIRATCGPAISSRLQQRIRTTLSRGGERTRTADFYVANVALYQLSYTPVAEFRIAPLGVATPAPPQHPKGLPGGDPADGDRLLELGRPRQVSQLRFPLDGVSPQTDEKAEVDDEQGSAESGHRQEHVEGRDGAHESGDEQPAEKDDEDIASSLAGLGTEVGIDASHGQGRSRRQTPRPG